MSIQLLFPMCGRAIRFKNAGIDDPKPLIDVQGMAMVLRAVNSFSNILSDTRVKVSIIFVTRQDHEDEHKLRTRLMAAMAPMEAASQGRINVKFVTLELGRETGGAVESCMLARNVIDPATPIVVMDCDLYFRCAAYEHELLQMCFRQSDTAGLLTYFESNAPRYSFAELANCSNVVVRTAEKNPISTHALIGSYAFATGGLFIDAADRLLQLPLDADAGRKEYFVSLLYNGIIARGGVVRAMLFDEFCSFGTPEELESYLKGEQSYRKA